MTQMTDLDLVRRMNALQTLADERRADMKRRWPNIDFDADSWPIKTLYGTRMLDVHFNPAKKDFATWDAEYLVALRCFIATAALDGKRIHWNEMSQPWRMLAIHLPKPIPLAALRHHHLQDLENKAVSEVSQQSAARLINDFNALAIHLEYLARKGAADRFLWSISLENKRVLAALVKVNSQSFKKAKAEILDRQIEALSEATNAMCTGDGRLDRSDRAAIAIVNILMCAPSRINEVLTLKVGDRFTIEDYTVRPENRERDKLQAVHQLLLMKGSKGAAWSPKPVLNFMIDLLEKCWQIMLDVGKRSRTLVTWYEQNPNRLYLPPELEHLRGKPLRWADLWQIVNLTSDEPSASQLTGTHGNFASAVIKYKHRQTSVKVLVDNPQPYRADGSRASKVQALQWAAVEEYLLNEVHKRMHTMRRVTISNHYTGPLSEMLALIDTEITPYLPDSVNTYMMISRLNGKGGTRSVFAKLGLRMTQGGKEVNCYLGTHDPRRWLTTQALVAQGRLSDVLINKWANRLSLAQLSKYDLRTDEQKADQSSIPLPNELTDMSDGLQDLEDQASQYGLSTEIVVAHKHGISVTSMEAICEATEDRPVARTGGQILILYPTRFGACVHQHHETPCRSYVCGPCGEQRTIKGHLPTNEEWRKEEDLTYRSIVNQLQALVTARNRGIADDQQTFDAHLVTLVKEGLKPPAMADELIDHFHEIKNQIRDLSFRNELEQAFVARGVVERLDDPEVPSGALIKYHNPKRHAAPGHELAIETHFGSREDMDHQSELFYQEHPELAPEDLALRDERHLLCSSEDDKDSDYAQTA